MFTPHIVDKTFLLKNNTYYLKGMSQQILKLLTVVFQYQRNRLSKQKYKTLLYDDKK